MLKYDEKFMKYFILEQFIICYTNIDLEPRHDKTNIMGLRLAWIQTSLRADAVLYQFLYLL
jgi:hypothetical protein